MSHTVVISDELWDAVRRYSKDDGPATVIRNVVTKWVLEQNGNGGTSTKRKEKSKPSKGWNTDKKMENHLPQALAEFQAHYREFWPKNNEKDVDEIGDFLEDLADNEIEDIYDLTDKQKGLLGVVRRMHMKWVRGKKQRDEDDESPFET